jgi:hypothetical protein
MKDLFSTKPRCPRCNSSNVVQVTPQTLACTGAGGLIGGIVAAAVSNDGPNGVTAGPVVAGALTGALAGLGLGKEIQKGKSGKPYICLRCFHAFPYFSAMRNHASGRQKNRLKSKTRPRQRRRSSNQEAKQ